MEFLTVLLDFPVWCCLNSMLQYNQFFIQTQYFYQISYVPLVTISLLYFKLFWSNFKLIIVIKIGRICQIFKTVLYSIFFLLIHQTALNFICGVPYHLLLWPLSYGININSFKALLDVFGLIVDLPYCNVWYYKHSFF